MNRFHHSSVPSYASLPAGLPARPTTDSYRLLKAGIWVYFFLLILEGGIRRWFLPSLAAPLLVVRDPFAIGLIVLTGQRGLLTFNLYVVTTVLIGIVGIYTAVLLGHGSLTVAVYGARILLLHFPLMFVIGRVFSREDVIRMGRTMVWLSVPMVVLIAIQFYSPQSAWVNRGVGGDMEGAGFDGALGYFRPPATFSFYIGTTLFFGLLTSFIFYFWLQSKEIGSLLLLVATTGLIAAIPLSISRALLSHVAVSTVFVGLALIRKPALSGRFVFIAFITVFALAVLSQTGLFNTAIEAFLTRFENASESEGGLGGTFFDRFLGGLTKPITESLEQPFFGYGLGMGTNAGAMLLAGSKDVFLISEGEWGRLIGELGPVMGLTMILVRLGLTVEMGFASYQKLAAGDLLPWLLLSFGVMVIPQVQWAQPTALGFSTLIGGLLLASLRTGEKVKSLSQPA